MQDRGLLALNKKHECRGEKFFALDRRHESIKEQRHTGATDASPPSCGCACALLGVTEKGNNSASLRGEECSDEAIQTFCVFANAPDWLRRARKLGCFAALAMTLVVGFARSFVTTCKAQPQHEGKLKKKKKKKYFSIHSIKKNDTFAARNYSINMKQFFNLNSLHDSDYKPLFFTGKWHAGKDAFQADCGTLTFSNGPRHFSNNSVLYTRVHAHTHVNTHTHTHTHSGQAVTNC
jgi:hypothetical protein